MSENKSELSSLPMNTLKDIPQSKAEAKKIIALVKKNGRIAGYQLSDGRILEKEEGIELAKQGGISGVGIASRNGNEYLKALPDGSDDNNLSRLPSVKQ